MYAFALLFLVAGAIAAPPLPTGPNGVLINKDAPLSDAERAQADRALHSPDLFEGDILGLDPQVDRNAISNENMRWTGKTIPYVIDNSLGNYANLIKQGMQQYHDHTCVRFVPRSNQRNYVRIFYGQGCYSMVGMQNYGEQALSLGNGCLHVGTVIHELGHALGFWHEQNRSDRDNYLIIYWNNIQNGMGTQFYLMKPHENILYNNFDYHSIMIYGNYAFSYDGRSATMVAKNNQRLYEPYDKNGMTWSDVHRVNKMYNC
ncbi:astacin-like metalloprotease toxin 5 [Uloborus diversus]|uniref:astacin-like metalloprotease toxin 5 n=1 Tax=Uloborus diversus TaxID=327109 RepID=UPI00240A1938|nr:astacin-like metalloprotease toxin 5 [Uloborus diversus]